MDISKFNLWRACFSFCFVDGFLSVEERNWIDEKLDLLNFTDNQKTMLLKDLISPPNIEDIMPLISLPADRGFLVNHIRLLSKLDNETTEVEKKKIEQIKAAVLAKVDLKALSVQIAELEKASFSDDEVFIITNRHSYVERLLKNLMKKMNSGDFKSSRK